MNLTNVPDKPPGAEAILDRHPPSTPPISLTDAQLEGFIDLVIQSNFANINKNDIISSVKEMMAHKKANKTRPHQPRPEFQLSGLLLEHMRKYDALRDQHLTEFLGIHNRRKILIKTGILTQDGCIVSSVNAALKRETGKQCRSVPKHDKENKKAKFTVPMYVSPYYNKAWETRDCLYKRMFVDRKLFEDKTGWQGNQSESTIQAYQEESEQNDRLDHIQQSQKTSQVKIMDQTQLTRQDRQFRYTGYPGRLNQPDRANRINQASHFANKKADHGEVNQRGETETRKGAQPSLHKVASSPGIPKASSSRSHGQEAFDRSFKIQNRSKRNSILNRSSRGSGPNDLANNSELGRFDDIKEETRTPNRSRRASTKHAEDSRSPAGASTGFENTRKEMLRNLRLSVLTRRVK
jgi:hypothetical protein